MECRSGRWPAKLGVSRGTVDRTVASCAPPQYVRRSTRTSFDRVQPAVRMLRADTPLMPATAIAER